MCDYDEIYRVVEEKRNLFHAKGSLQSKLGRVCVVEDAAHAFGSVWKGRMCGQIADITCFSFHAVKNLTTAEGGAVVWRNDIGISDSLMYKKFMLYSLHGQTKDASEKLRKGAWEYDIAFPGYKCNMTDITAALGMAQLSRFEGLLARRDEIYRRYDAALLPLGIRRLEHVGADFKTNAHLYMVWIPGIDEQIRNEMIIRMAAAGVAVNVHFKPLPLFTAYKNLGFHIEDYPNAYGMFAGEITLPMHTLLSDKDIDYVIETFTGVLAPYKDAIAAGNLT
jgi:dTDP-4-amino-4,6-dideoxygalactose transaminase